jgi:hypothetical protein
MVATTAIRSPTDDINNHTIVLRQLKEVAEVGQRLRGDPTESFVRVKELVNAGIARFTNNQIQSPENGVTSGGVPATRQVNTSGSLTGGGALSADLTLSLVGDSSSPGNSMLYGTNGSGTKGWFAQPSGFSSPLTTKGDLYTRSASADARLAVGANGTVLTADSTQTNGIKWATPSGGSGTAPVTQVQAQYLRNTGSSATLTLSSAPTVGNVLLAFAMGFDNTSPSHLGLPAGFSTTYYNQANTDGILIGVRVVQSGDGTSWGTFTGGNGGNVYGIIEFSGVASVTLTQLAQPTTSGLVMNIPNVPSATNAITILLAESDVTNAYASVTGATLLFDGTNTTGSNNHPGVVLQVTKLSNVAITYSTTSTFGTTIAAVIQVVGVATTIQSSGNVTPDFHPSTPTSWDDEFEYGTAIDTTGARFSGAQAWTGYTANTISSVVAQGALQKVTQGTGTSAGAGYAYPVPAGTWTFVWKGLRPAFEVFNLSTWKGYYFGTTGTGNNFVLQHETRNWATGSYSFGASDATFTSNNTPVYFMLQYDGTNLIFSWSPSGYTNDFTTLLTVAASTWVGTPDHIGFGTSPAVCVDWIRRTA